jgi:hypothetical protein
VPIRLAALVALVVICVGSVAACGGRIAPDEAAPPTPIAIGVEPAPQPAPAPTESAPPTPSSANGDAAAAPLPVGVMPSPNPFHPGDRWSGTYVCPQGSTELTLVIESVTGEDLDAEFDFDWVAGQASGSFHLTGTFDPITRRATFEPGAWIVRPGDNWYTVGLDGTVDVAARTYAGAITGPGCGAFALQG